MSNPPFDYTVRISPRGRSVRLRVTFQRGLEVIVPQGYDTAKVPPILERKKHWIRVALDRAESHRKFFTPKPAWSLPVQIKLPAIGAVWHVMARETEAPWVAARELAVDRLLVFGAISDEAAARGALARWLMRKTREHLVPRLESLSLKAGLRHERTFVKFPRTRWASCSRHRTISLNAKLLFLPAELVDYSMVHELCHLVEMNHSERFWQMVRRHCPEFRRLDSRLRDMWKVVPRWAF